MFMDFVHYLTNDKHAPGTLMDDLAHAVMSICQIKCSKYPDLISLLASINMCANHMDAAQVSLWVLEDICGTQGVLPAVTPYSEIISTLNDIDSKNGDVIQDMLICMRLLC